MTRQLFQSLLIGVLLASTPADAATLQGKVTTDSEVPIGRVRITIQPHSSIDSASHPMSARTDETGTFLIEDVVADTYLIAASKEGWIPVEQFITVVDRGSSHPTEVAIQMELTPVRKLLARIQIGSLAYVLLFGLLILAFNFYLAPEPSKGVAVTGWSVIALSVVIAFFKLEWTQTLLLAGLGVAVGGLIHRFGTRTASIRLGQEEAEVQEQRAVEANAKQQLTSLVGRRGVAMTDLKSCGRVQIDEDFVEVRAVQGFVAAGTPVVVTAVDGTVPIVEECK